MEKRKKNGRSLAMGCGEKAQAAGLEKEPVYPSTGTGEG